jgi:serine/threonine protein phosphatase 1
MLSELVRSRRPQASIPAGTRVYAIGDMHGRLDLFEALLDLIVADNRMRPAEKPEIILLGDYIDRGPQSAQILDRISLGPPEGFSWTALRGNHEQAFLDVLQRKGEPLRLLDLWLVNGGREALRSYGLPSIMAYSDDLEAILASLQALVPASHVRLLSGLPLTRRVGDYLFVHAGVRPGVALDSQTPHDLLWIRSPFLGSRDDHSAVIVHGHSISAEVEDCGNRIGIDTGAYATGRLTALVLEGRDRRFLATAPD